MKKAAENPPPGFLDSKLNPPLISYPARPVNGGRLEDAPPKVGPWVYQPKIDDWRAIAHAPTRRIWNRHGQPMSISDDLADVLEILRHSSFDWLDIGVMERRNQLLRNSIVVFDTLDMPSFDHQQRRAHLEIAFEFLPLAFELARRKTDTQNQVFLVNQFNPLDLWDLLQDENRQAGSAFYEGIVAKRTDKPYPIQLLSPNKETPWMIKHRFDQ